MAEANAWGELPPEEHDGIWDETERDFWSQFDQAEQEKATKWEQEYQSESTKIKVDIGILTGKHNELSKTQERVARELAAIDEELAHVRNDRDDKANRLGELEMDYRKEQQAMLEKREQVSISMTNFFRLKRGLEPLPEAEVEQRRVKLNGMLRAEVMEGIELTNGHAEPNPSTLPPHTPAPGAERLVDVVDADSNVIGPVERIEPWNQWVEGIQDLPVRRSVMIRRGRRFSHDHLATIYERSEAKGVKWLACMIQAIGEIQTRRCQSCDKNQGAFENCIIVGGELYPKCGNCEWNRQGCHGASREGIDVAAARQQVQEIKEQREAALLEEERAKKEEEAKEAEAERIVAAERIRLAELEKEAELKRRLEAERAATLRREAEDKHRQEEIRLWNLRAENADRDARMRESQRRGEHEERQRAEAQAQSMAESQRRLGLAKEHSYRLDQVPRKTEPDWRTGLTESDRQRQAQDALRHRMAPQGGDPRRAQSEFLQRPGMAHDRDREAARFAMEKAAGMAQGATHSHPVRASTEIPPVMPPYQVRSNGPRLSASPQNGPPIHGPPTNGPPMNGPPTNGPPTNGPPTNGPPTNGPPLDRSNGALPHRLPTNGLPGHGPQAQGPPGHGPSSHGPPGHGPPGHPGHGPPGRGSPSHGLASHVLPNHAPQRVPLPKSAPSTNGGPVVYGPAPAPAPVEPREHLPTPGFNPATPGFTPANAAFTPANAGFTPANIRSRPPSHETPVASAEPSPQLTDSVPATEEPLEEITRENLALKHDGTIYTHPRCMYGVPLEKVHRGHWYWEESWQDVDAIIRPQWESWKVKYNDAVKLQEEGKKGGSSKYQIGRQVNRGTKIFGFLEKGAISPYQLLGKPYVQTGKGGITSYDTLFRLSETLDALSKFKLDVTPVEWLRHRLWELIEAERTRFNLSKTIHDFYHDPKLSALRHKHGFKNIGRPSGMGVKPRQSMDGASDSPKAKRPALSGTDSGTDTPSLKKRKGLHSAEGTPRGTPAPEPSPLVTHVFVAPETPASAHHLHRKGPLDGSNPFEPNEVANYSDADSITGTVLQRHEFRVYRVKTRLFTSSPHVTQYWSWVQDEEILSHRILKHTPPLRWYDYDAPINFSVQPAEIRLVVWNRQALRVHLMMREDIGVVSKLDGKPRGDVMAEFKRERTLLRFVDFVRMLGFETTHVETVHINQRWDDMRSEQLTPDEEGRTTVPLGRR